jgi:hypothetical protein
MVAVTSRGGANQPDIWRQDSTTSGARFDDAHKPANEHPWIRQSACVTTATQLKLVMVKRLARF